MIHSINIRRKEPTDFKKFVDLRLKVFLNKFYTDENKNKSVDRLNNEQHE
jgi:hypothetical protein